MTHELVAHDLDDSAAEEPQEAQVPRTALTWLDAQALVGLIDGDPQPLLEWVSNSATALSGSARAEARSRLLARCIASTRAKAAIFENLLDARIAAGDRAGASMVDAVLTSTIKRLTLLMAEHRACSAPTRDQVISVGHADTVYVARGEK